MSLKYIRDNYHVPAKRGGRVIYDDSDGPRMGTITCAYGARLGIRLDGEKNSQPYHPTWKLRYLEGEVAK